MSLSQEYERQFEWRAWSRVLDLLPALDGRLVVDLGCGIGDQAALLAARGASVLAVDADDDLLATARARAIPQVEFIRADLRQPLDHSTRVDGMWCSFAAAYLPELGPVLERWKTHLKAGGWLALIDVDDLFGHEPLRAETRALLDGYASEALRLGRHDFKIGRKLRDYALRAGFATTANLILEDQELSFQGPAPQAVLEAWSQRFDRMLGLQAFCGASFEAVREDFLKALVDSNHRSRTQVHCCVARLPVVQAHAALGPA